MEMSTEIWWALGLAAGLAGMVQGVTGFGFGMVAMAAWTPVIGPKNANLLVTPLAGVTILVALWQVRREVDWRRALPLGIGGLLGTPVGVFILFHSDPILLRRLIGGGIIVAAMTSLRGVCPADKPAWPGWALAAGMLGGVMAGVVAMAGPPAVVYTYRQPWALPRIKATLLCYFALTVGYRLALFIGSGAYTPWLTHSMAFLVPLAALATWTGSRLSEHLPRRLIEWIVAGLLILAGLGLLLK
jgi:uncharacterized membrane protein YfcA